MTIARDYGSAISHAHHNALLQQGFKNPRVRIPLEGAVLALLPPHTKEHDDTEDLSRPPGLSIHCKYPLDMILSKLGPNLVWRTP